MISADFNAALSGCCEFGKQWSINGQSCAVLPPKISSSLGGTVLCTSTATECCEATTSALKCFYGLWDYKQLYSCNYDNGADAECDDRESCCHCCRIGKRAAEDHGSCDGSMQLPEPCRSSYLACCNDQVKSLSPIHGKGN